MLSICRNKVNQPYLRANTILVSPFFSLSALLIEESSALISHFGKSISPFLELVTNCADDYDRYNILTNSEKNVLIILQWSPKRGNAFSSLTPNFKEEDSFQFNPTFISFMPLRADVQTTPHDI